MRRQQVLRMTYAREHLVQAFKKCSSFRIHPNLCRTDTLLFSEAGGGRPAKGRWLIPEREKGDRHIAAYVIRLVIFRHGHHPASPGQDAPGRRNNTYTQDIVVRAVTRHALHLTRSLEPPHAACFPRDSRVNRARIGGTAQHSSLHVLQPHLESPALAHMMWEGVTRHTTAVHPDRCTRTVPCHAQRIGKGGHAGSREGSG
jgi:hypothetical protein